MSGTPTERRKKPTKVDLAAALQLATAALLVEPGSVTTTEPARVTVTIYA